MASTYTTMQELRDNLGIGTLYLDATVEECTQTAQDLLNQYLWFDNAPVVAALISNNTATVMLANPGIFVTGQSVTIAAAGSTYNGTYTLTGSAPGTTGPSNLLPAFWSTWAYSLYPYGYSVIQYAKTASDDPFHRVLPYGTATGPDTKTASYATTAAIRQASMILSVDIWQARQTSMASNGMDGVTASPYRLGYQMINRIRGLIQPYSNPSSLVG